MTFPAWLPPILATQKRVAALQPIRGLLDIPWGLNCQTMRNETSLRRRQSEPPDYIGDFMTRPAATQAKRNVTCG